MTYGKSKFQVWLATRQWSDDLRNIGQGIETPFMDSEEPVAGYIYDGSYVIGEFDHEGRKGWHLFLTYDEVRADLLSCELDLFYWYGPHGGEASGFDGAKGLDLFDRMEIGALQSDLDSAVRYIQDGLGVDEGLQASMFFSGLEDGEWSAMEPWERCKMLRDYAASEISGEVSERIERFSEVQHLSEENDDPRVANAAIIQRLAALQGN
jgi:hypothetical protein